MSDLNDFLSDLIKERIRGVLQKHALIVDKENLRDSHLEKKNESGKPNNVRFSALKLMNPSLIKIIRIFNRTINAYLSMTNKTTFILY